MLNNAKFNDFAIYFSLNGIFTQQRVEARDKKYAKMKNYDSPKNMMLQNACSRTIKFIISCRIIDYCTSLRVNVYSQLF